MGSATTGIGAAGVMEVIKHVPGLIADIGQIVVAIVGIIPAIKLLFKKKKVEPETKTETK